jgi:hypothetical protein
MLTSLVVIEMHHLESLILIIWVIVFAMTLPRHRGMIGILRSLTILFCVPAIPCPKRLIVLSTQFLADRIGGTLG